MILGCSSPVRFGSISLLIFLFLPVFLGAAGAPGLAQAQFEGEWRAGAMRVQVSVQTWGPDCGPRPEATAYGGGVTSIQALGDHLVFQGGMQGSSNGCWTQNREVRRRSSSVQAGQFRTTCSTTPDNPRREHSVHTLATGTDFITYRGETRYEWTLNDSQCTATIQATQSLARIGEATTEPAQPTQPAQPAIDPPAPASATTPATPPTRPRLRDRDVSDLLAEPEPTRRAHRDSPGSDGRDSREAAGLEAEGARGDENTSTVVAIIVVVIGLAIGLLLGIGRQRKRDERGAASEEWTIVGQSLEALKAREKDEAPLRTRPVILDEPDRTGDEASLAQSASERAGSDPEHICPICRRGYAAGVRRCPVDQEEVIPFARFLSQRKEAESRDQKRACPTCGEKYEASQAFCPQDGTAL